ncbi:PepSY domain-containing protein [Nitrospirillum amazonense]|uniref:PepSY-associated TM helix domain-containing protein n=1 Tax=Nitrospirillum amazonense TaxID=28077 RepID=UPI002DD430F3|nr:PepSY domain-containing protein [Nitrospirillum amazonense]MEC4595228.1 PepSY domain-containing protein [Nitrospirillum amazonense]
MRTVPLQSPSGAAPSAAPRRSWPDHAAVWRWHFYAALFCLPFFCWLAVTGSIYLFRPDIEAWIDRPYESLHLDGPRAAPSSEARAAVAAVPGSVFSRYEPPATPTGAAQVVVARDGKLFRVYVHPGTLQAMSIGRNDHRIMELMAHLHGQLLLGDTGSVIVELAGSWGVVMILTGLYLWLPRGKWRPGGLVYPRLGGRGRLFWRDLHAVTGLWISMVTLFLLLSGLPWTTSWGRYFSWIRNHWAVTSGPPDWPIGAKEEPPPSVAPPSSMPGMTAAEMAAMPPPAPPPTPGAHPSSADPGPDLRVLDTIVPAAANLPLPRPVWILPPTDGGRDWIVSSQAQNRPLRVTYALAPDSGAVTGTKTFDDKNTVDRVVNIAIATHEGQLFGRLNQAILLLNALGVLLVAVSAAVMWWRRRPVGRLGAPPQGARPRFSALLAISIVALALLIPLFGVSLLLVLGLETALLRRFPTVRRWLGLEAPVV